MRASGLLLCAAVFAWSQAAAAPTPAGKPKSWKPGADQDTATSEAFTGTSNLVRWINGVPDTGQFLADTTVLVRVGPRVVRAKEFVDSYFDSYAEFRPPSDSLGRVQFMNSTVNKEIMGLVARAVNPPLTFEDRAVLRGYTQRALSNALMQRAILDSVEVTEPEIRHVYDQLGYVQRLRQIVFKDRETAFRVREALAGGKLGWAAAYPKYNQRAGMGELGDIGYIEREKLDAAIRSMIYDLKPGEYSVPFEDPEGWHVVQVSERTPRKRVAYEGLRTLLEGEVRNAKIRERSTVLQDRIRERFGVTYDSTNIAFASSKFTALLKNDRESDLAGLRFSSRVPRFSDEDTSRVLARHRDGLLTLGMFMDHYRATPPLLRAPVNTPSLFRSEVDTQVLEGYRAIVAQEMGLENDPMTVAWVDKRRELMLVEHLYQDSVASKVTVTPEQRRKYYRDHIAQYVTSAQVRFAAFVATGKAGADSLVARLRAGEKPEAILLADSLAGLKKRGSVQTQYQHEVALPFHKQLFEDLKPGQVEAYGPDETGQYIILNPLEFIPGRQMPYGEAERYVDESVQNITAERLLNEFLDRHRTNYRIETHPELVMQLRWIDPTTL